MTTRPNFLYIITDQHRADHLGCYGNPLLKTPAIDGLAAAGARFTRFYTATPICMPNRATLMTGRMPSLHGARQNGIPLRFTATTFVDLLRAAGYATALIGKCHLQSINGNVPTIGMPGPRAGFLAPPDEMREADKTWRRHGRYDQELPSTWQRDPEFEPQRPYYGFDHVELAIGHGDRVVGHYERWLRSRHPDPASLRGPENQLQANECAAPQAWRTRMPEELYPTSFVAERTIAYLEQHARTAADRPFFLQCSFPDPHHPFTPPGKYWSMYDPDEVSLPRAFYAGERPLPPHLRRLYDERDQGKSNREGQRVFAVREREAREAIALTYGMIRMIDDAIGRVLRRLSELGLAGNTVVVFNSDHGDFMGDHQLLLKGALHYQGLIRVPLIWADPSAPRTGVACDDLYGTLDLAVTFLERAGLQPYNGIQGRSLLPALEGKPGGHDAILIEEHQRRGYMGLSNNFRARSLVTKDHRLTIYQGVGWGELYDLEHDTEEWNNLWDDARARTVRGELTEALARKMMELGESSPLATHHGP